jgi:beta-glucanase (GH16 family)
VNRTFIILLLILGFENSIFSQFDVVYNKLVWADEFDTNGAINSANWHHQTQLPDGNSWYNGEQQHYTNRTDNSFVSNGQLNIVAKKETFTNQTKTKNYTSARLNSKFAFKYGRVDVRAKLPIGAGTWPAIWLLGKNIIEPGAYFTAQYGTTNWPACGEIDIMEHGIFPSKSVNFVSSAIHTTSSSGSTVNQGGITLSNVGTDFHVYTMNWSPNQLSFFVDNVHYYTYNPTVKNASTWPFDKEQYILLNIAMGGVAGTIPSSFNQESMVIDYVRIYQLADTVKKDTVPKDTIQIDTLAPTNFTAKLGTISSRSIELLLNAQDKSDSIYYQIKYGTNQINIWGLTGIEKSITLKDLTPETDYSIEITAQDKAGNKVLTPITLKAKTSPWLGCKGTASSAQDGNFSKGYTYSYESVGSELIIDYELLDTDKSGAVAFLITKNPYSELATTAISTHRFHTKLSGLAPNTKQDYAVKFSYAGGYSISNYLSYTLGENCSSTASINSDVSQFSFQNPVENILKIQSTEKIDELLIYNYLGQKVFSTNDIMTTMDISHLPFGAYQLMIRAKDKFTNYKLIKNN